jgi:hypothetical protein
MHNNPPEMITTSESLGPVNILYDKKELKLFFNYLLKREINSDYLSRSKCNHIPNRRRGK